MRTQLLVLALIACGDDGVHHLADSGVDGSAPQPDAPTDAPTPGVVTVTVTLQGSPAAAVPVYFQNADSSVVSSTTTGSDGTATATMGPGGFVTVLEPNPPAPPPPDFAGSGSVTNVNGQVLDTFSGVKPGDNLHVDVDPASPINQQFTFDVTIPLDPASTNNEYFIGTTCGESFFAVAGSGASLTSPVEQVSVFGTCAGSATADVIVQSFDGNGNPLNSFFVPNTVLTDGGEVDLTGTYTAVGTETYKLTNVPATVNDDEAFVVYATSRGLVDDLGGIDSTPSGGSDTLSFGVAAADPALQQANFLLEFPTGAPIDSQTFVSWGSASTGEIDTDVSTVHLRSWVTRPVLNVVTNQIEWSVEKSGNVPDALITHFDANRTDPVNGSSSWTWNVAAAGATDGAIPLPTLPTDIFDFNVHDSDNANVFTTSGVTVPGGYDAIRGQIFDDEALLIDSEDVGSISATGTLVAQTTNGGVGFAAAKSTHRKAAHPLHLRHRPTGGHGIGILSSMFTTLRAAH